MQKNINLFHGTGRHKETYLNVTLDVLASLYLSRGTYLAKIITYIDHDFLANLLCNFS